MSRRSTRSSATSTVSSILKKTPSTRSRISFGNATPNRVRFSFPYNKRIRNVLQSFLDNKDSRDFENLVCVIRDTDMQDDEVKSLLKEVTNCIPMLGKELRLFVEALLVIKWNVKGEKVVKLYQSFLVNLLTAHNYYLRSVMEMLLGNFLPDVGSVDWVDGIPSDDDCNRCFNVHMAVRKILEVIPMSRDILIQCLITRYPYFKKPTHTHEFYLHNLLWVIEYEPKFRSDLLHLIFSRLIILDVNSPREEIEKAENYEDEELTFKMEEDEWCENDYRHPLAHTLDVCIDKLMNFFHMQCHDLDTGQLIWDKAKVLYHDLVTIFDKAVLPTYGTQHVQFLIFYVCSFRATMAEAFLNYLWKKVTTVNVPVIHRQSAVAYIASFIARSNVVSLPMLKGTLQEMAFWIHNYISAYDGAEGVNPDIRVHAVFYSMCQGLFYAVAFRHNEIFNGKKNLSFVDTLNLPKIVACPLNPLKVCQPVVVQTFAAVTRAHQVAYCYSIIERNSRQVIQTIYQDEKGCILTANNLVDDFFPFDPCSLKRSKAKIEPFYREYVEYPLNCDEIEMGETDDDDFIVEPNTSDKSGLFSYGSSPGFKFRL